MENEIDEIFDNINKEKKGICERCKKEMIIPELTLGELRDSINQAIHGEETTVKFVKRPPLCHECIKGYNKLIDKTNQEIENYLKEI